MLSAYQRGLADKCTTDHGEKLTPNLMAKQQYVLHYRNLQLYLSLGMRLTKVHRILRFRQAPWMRSYIDFNTELRKSSTTDFEKDFYKLLNNAVS